MFGSVESVQLRVGARRLVKYPTDPWYWHERRILATSDEEEAERNGTVAVLAPDWDTSHMAENEMPRVMGQAEPLTTRRATTGSRSTASLAHEEGLNHADHGMHGLFIARRAQMIEPKHEDWVLPSQRKTLTLSTTVNCFWGHRRRKAL